MPILHKNITASADIHNPKWFSDANNGDYAWRNEQGNLETIDELLLPAALNFVDASVAPPTSNANDVYVLSSGGSVHVDWGSVSVNDWVRYDGAAWNSITPQKSSLCYDETLDKLNSFDGTAWAAIGGDSIYTADGTIGSGRILTITDSVRFKDGTFEIEGDDTLSTSTALAIYDGDATPNKLWDFRNNGDVVTGQDVSIIGDNSTFFKLSILRPTKALNNGAVYSVELYNSSNVRTEYGRFLAIIQNNTAGSETGTVKISAVKNGTMTDHSIFDYVNGLTVNDVASTNLLTVGDILTVSKTNTDVTVKGGFKPFNLYRSVSGVNNAVGIDLSLNNSSSIKTPYGAIYSQIVNSTAGSENGNLQLQVVDNGTITTKMEIKSNTINLSSIPTSSAGLVAGDIWNDSGTLKIV